MLVKGDTGPPGRCQNAPPVGVTARKSSLDQWGSGYRFGDTVSVVVAGRAADVEGDKFGGPFAVAHDLVG